MAMKFLDENGVSTLCAGILGKVAGNLANYVQTSDLISAIQAALSEYATNTGVQSAIAVALTNYMTTDDTNAAIAQAVADAASMKFEKVDSLPNTGESNVIYLVPNGGTDTNVKDEYMWIDDAWELMGSTSIDLTQYWSKSELQAITTDELAAILV